MSRLLVVALFPLAALIPGAAAAKEFRPNTMPKKVSPNTPTTPPPPPMVDLDGDGFADPPADDAAYDRWFKVLPLTQRTKITKHCKKHGGDYQEVCGGIGPLRIPIPPSMMPTKDGGPPDGDSRDAWYKRLTKAQRRYVDRFCGDTSEGNPNMYTELCGATPLVVAFDSQRVAFTSAPGRFAFQPGDAVATDWPTAVTPWLAIDRDGDGAITSGAELFGGDTQLASGGRGANGFVALAELDTNGDGRIDVADPAFASLLLWSDRDADRTSSTGELAPASRSIVSISLDYRSEPHCTARLNCERERAGITWRDATGGVREGTIVDVYLAYR